MGRKREKGEEEEGVLMGKVRDRGDGDEERTAGGRFAVHGNVKDHNGRITASGVITCIVAASGGLIFGYDIGVSGGVTMMIPFLQKFFPSVLRKMDEADHDNYCTFDSKALTTFSSSLYIAGLVSSLVAGPITATMGRKFTMILGGSTFLMGTAINTAAINLGMLIMGRIFLGLGIGFTNQATPVYLSEMAPPKWRGAVNTGFQFFIGIGVLAANFITFRVSQYGEWAWRLSLGMAAIPASLMTLGALFISDSPGSLVERGKLPQARQSLVQVRGVDSTYEAELNDIINWSEAAKALNQEPFKMILQRQYRPHLILSMAIPFFQQLTGINVIAFFAPVLFRSIGFGSHPALFGAVILGMVNLGSITISAFLVDRCGRRAMFMEGGIQMVISQIIIACVVGLKIGTSSYEPFSKNASLLTMVFMCIYTAAFAWSWGPLTWLIPSEILPLEIRPAGQSISVAVQFMVTFILAQAFLSMLCHLKYAIFLFYAAWIVVMTIFIALFLPETKGIPLESMDLMWEKHWYWHRFV